MPEEVIEEEDYRGVLALVFAIGFFGLAFFALGYLGIDAFLAVTGALTTPFTLILKWYFESK